MVVRCRGRLLGVGEGCYLSTSSKNDKSPSAFVDFELEDGDGVTKEKEKHH